MEPRPTWAKDLVGQELGWPKAQVGLGLGQSWVGQGRWVQVGQWVSPHADRDLVSPHVPVFPQGHVLPRLPLQPVPGPRAQGVSGAAGNLRQGWRW